MIYLPDGTVFVDFPPPTFSPNTRKKKLQVIQENNKVFIGRYR